MASITIRRLDEVLKTRLRVQAALHGRSMEEEARDILKAGLTARKTGNLNLVESIRRHVDPLGGVEIALPRREPVRRPPTKRSANRQSMG
jgi:plasmid stability protein